MQNGMEKLKHVLKLKTFWGVTFHMRQRSCLFTKQLHHNHTLRVTEHFSTMTHSYIHTHTHIYIYPITITAFSSTVLWDAYHVAI